MKCITLLLDGASDRSYKCLGNLTPLQYSHTPNLDALAKKSQCGLMTVLKEGLALSTDLAHFILFGYKISQYPSRAIIDALGEKIPIDKEAIYLRCSLAKVTYTDHYRINSRFVEDFDSDQAKAIETVLDYQDDHYTYRWVHSYDAHGFLEIKGNSMSKDISDSDPFYTDTEVLAIEPYETDSKESLLLSNHLNAYLKRAYNLLNNHEINIQREKRGLGKVNFLLTKWAGQYNHVPSFKTLNGLGGLMLGQSKLLEGLSEFTQMTYQAYRTFEEAVDLSLSADFSYVHLHTKKPDEASHKKDPFLKVKALETIDKALGPLLDFDGLLIVTSDHSTPCNSGSIHSGESVAFMAKGPYIRQDNVDKFNEIDCSKGSLHLEGSSFMDYVLNALDQTKMFHLRQGKSYKKYRFTEGLRKL
jgi:2,3-bisphosphoglycerate-independent phosphoglycerate mutase